jgi:hypothetical protein
VNGTHVCLLRGGINDEHHTTSFDIDTNKMDNRITVQSDGSLGFEYTAFGEDIHTRSAVQPNAILDKDQLDQFSRVTSAVEKSVKRAEKRHILAKYTVGLLCRK